MKCQKCEDANDPVKLRAEIDALRKRNAKNEDDAARYRWLRDSKNAYPLFFIAQRDPNNIVVQFTGELADMNIDEMMKTPNVELTGSGQVHRPESSEQSERG